MHICFATIESHDSAGGGGIASYVNALAKGLISRGHEVTVLVRGSEPTMTDDAGIRLVHAPTGNIHWYFHRLHAHSLAVLPVRELEWSWMLRRALQRVTVKSAVDVVETAHYGGLFLTGRARPPVVARLHGDSYTFAKYAGRRLTAGIRLERRIERAAWERAAVVTAPSRDYASEIAATAGWPSDRIEVIPNPLDPEIVEQAHLAREESRDDGTTVLYVGRLAAEKGIIPLLRSVRLVARDVPPVRFVIAGARQVSVAEAELGSAVGTADTDEHVRFMGHVPRPELPELYRHASVYVMPSFYEPFGISAIEAMAFGLPVVATQAGGVAEVVEHGVTGLLVPPGDEKALAGAITRLLTNPDLRRRMGRAGRERVLSHYNLDRVLDMTLEVYERAIRRPHRRIG